MIAAFDADDLRRHGFVGFIPASTVDLGQANIPAGSGVYVVVRGSAEPPKFLDRGGGGWWKGRDPTVTHQRLRAEWVDGAETLYIGKADALCSRIGLLIGFSRGKPIMHWGGRLLWQLEKCEGLLVAWKSEPYFAALESDLIDEFVDEFGRLPFANLKRGDRNVPRPPVMRETRSEDE